MESSFTIPEDDQYDSYTSVLSISKHLQSLDTVNASKPKVIRILPSLDKSYVQQSHYSDPLVVTVLHPTDIDIDLFSENNSIKLSTIDRISVNILTKLNFLDMQN